jgi:hypothetical protein
LFSFLLKEGAIDKEVADQSLVFFVGVKEEGIGVVGGAMGILNHQRKRFEEAFFLGATVSDATVAVVVLTMMELSSSDDETEETLEEDMLAGRQGKTAIS